MSNFIDENRFIIRKDICGDRPISIVVCVLSRRVSIITRFAVRRTWASYAKGTNSKIALAFFIGNAPENEPEQFEKYIHKEQKMFEDIVQGDYVDHYHNLTFKSLNILMWANTYCKQVRHWWNRCF